MYYCKTLLQVSVLTAAEQEEIFVCGTSLYRHHFVVVHKMFIILVHSHSSRGPVIDPPL